jgi:glucose-6-phosphate dehydrogenase assembly protein OpcA
MLCSTLGYAGLACKNLPWTPLSRRLNDGEIELNNTDTCRFGAEIGYHLGGQHEVGILRIRQRFDADSEKNIYYETLKVQVWWYL